MLAFKRIGEAIMLFDEGDLYINAASGFVPVDERIKRSCDFMNMQNQGLKTLGIN